MGKFLSGEMLEMSRDKVEYKPAYQKKSKTKEPKKRVRGTIGFDSTL
jgi:hypothetical protein